MFVSSFKLHVNSMMIGHCLCSYFTTLENGDVTSRNMEKWKIPDGREVGKKHALCTGRLTDSGV